MFFMVFDISCPLCSWLNMQQQGQVPLPVRSLMSRDPVTPGTAGPRRVAWRHEDQGDETLKGHGRNKLRIETLGS